MKKLSNVVAMKRKHTDPPVIRNAKMAATSKAARVQAVTFWVLVIIGALAIVALSFVLLSSPQIPG